MPSPPVTKDTLKQQRFIDTLLQEHGITASKFSLEIEFIPAALPRLQKLQKENLTRLKKRVLKHAADTNKNLSVVRSFNAEQLMFYELHEIQEETKGILEYLFGIDRGDNSYYDSVIGSMRCAEMKLQPSDSGHMYENLKIFMENLNQKIRDYGLKITDPKIQLNVSFYKNNKNLFCPYNSEFRNIGAKIISGILTAISEGSVYLPFLYKSATGATPLISLNVGREGFARLVGENDNARLELRLSRTGAALSDIDIAFLIENIVKPGAMQGLNASKCSKHKLRKIKRGVFSRVSADYKVLTHVLQGSIIKNTLFGYKLEPPENYISGWLYLNFAKICEELGYEPISPTVDLETLKFLDSGKYPTLIKEYKASEEKRLDYYEFLKNKNERNLLEDLEFRFLKKYKDEAKINWPDDTEFHEHFMKQAEIVMTLPQILDIFRNIRIKKKNSFYTINWPEKTKLYGREFNFDSTKLQEKIKLSGIVYSYVKDKVPLPIPRYFNGRFFEGAIKPDILQRLTKKV